MPEPVETLQLRGSRKAYERKGEVGIVSGEMSAPECLDGEALAEWNRMASMLGHQQIESPMWRAALIQYCRAWQEYRRLDDICKELDIPWVVSDKGNLSRHPAFTQRDATWTQVLKMGREFGYTPASKTMVRLGGDGKDESTDRFFKGAS